MSSLLGRNARRVARFLDKDIGFCRKVDFCHTLKMDYQYRLESPVITYAILESGEGLMGLEVAPWPGQPIEGRLVRLTGVKVTLPCTVTVDLICNRVKIAGSEVPATFQPLQGRRFIATVRIVKKNGFEKTRTVMHYTIPSDCRIKAEYFDGEGYISYEDVGPSQARDVADWIKNHATPGRLLEIGCAYGYLLKCMQSLGWDVFGGDICSVAVKKAAPRIGNERVKVWNAEQDPCPFEGPFDALVLNDVLEHFYEPDRVLFNLLPLVKQNGMVFIRTANSESLSHALYGSDWEGFFDYSHHGILWTTPTNVTRVLQQCDFRIVECWTEGFWLVNCDPLCKVVSDAYISMESLGGALNFLNRGDFLRVVANRTK